MPPAPLRRLPAPDGPEVRITGAYPPPLPARARRRQPTSRPRERLASALAAAAVLLAAGTVGALLPHEESLRVDVPADLPVDVPVEIAAAPAAAPPPSAPAAAPGRAPAALPASEPVRIRVPVLGTTADIVHLGLQDDGEMEVPTGPLPVGWYDRSPTPGELGPAVLAGHVDWEGQRGAFAGLRELRPGDLVLVDRADGGTATFSVDRVTEPAKSDFPTEEVYGDIHHAGLRLITCGGDYDEATGEYESNVVVFARLVLG